MANRCGENLHTMQCIVYLPNMLQSCKQSETYTRPIKIPLPLFYPIAQYQNAWQSPGNCISCHHSINRNNLTDFWFITIGEMFSLKAPGQRPEIPQSIFLHNPSLQINSHLIISSNTQSGPPHLNNTPHSLSPYTLLILTPHSHLNPNNFTHHTPLSPNPTIPSPTPQSPRFTPNSWYWI